MRPTRLPFRVTAPASTLVSVAEIKAAQRIDADDEDTLIAGWLASATAHVETALGRKLVAQTWRHFFSGWGDRLRLAFPDAGTVVVQYTDTAGDAQTLSAVNYQLVEDYRGSVILWKRGATWPSLSDEPGWPVWVEAEHAIAAGDPALDAARQALQLIVGDWINHRETVVAGNVVATPVAVTVERLLAEHRARWVEA